MRPVIARTLRRGILRGRREADAWLATLVTNGRSVEG